MDPSTLPTKCPDADNGTPPHIRPTNSFLKKHFRHHAAASAPPDVAVIHRECLKNHAASLGGHALDGCGDFMPSPTANPADPTSLKCAACGCHRNFHRREPDDHAAPLAAHFLDFRHHGHPPPPLPPRRISPSPSLSLSPSPSPPPPPPPPSYYPSAPHILLALGTAVPEDHLPTTNHHQVMTPATPTALKVENPSGRKRFRTKFSQEQKEKMLSFSEKLGWKINKCDEGLVEEFCNEVGVGKTVLKVWMHNNKNTFGKRDITITTTTNHHHSTNGTVSFDNIAQNTIINNPNNDDDIDHCHKENSGVHLQVSTNGSSSSS